MGKKPFRLKLYRPRIRHGASCHYRMLETYVETGPSQNGAWRSAGFDLIEDQLGKEISYGSLFAYCFRRFGYPNAGWDDYKELAKYRLSTPEPDLYMEVVPYVGDASGISIRFMLERGAHEAIEAFEMKDRKAFLARRLAWIDSQGRPQWASRFVEYVNRDWGMNVETWEQAWPFFQMYQRSRLLSKESDEGVKVEWLDWADAQTKAYESVESAPGPFYRSKDILSWPNDDPLRKYALAVLAALIDLHTPVRVRDQAINAIGSVDDPRCIQKEPPVAGYPSGAIGNMAPVEFAELHGLIMQAGKGNAKRGIRKVLAAMKQLAPA